MTRAAARKRERRAELWERFGQRVSVTTERCALEAEAAHIKLEDCLAQLSVRAREVIGRSYFDEHTAPVIAEALDITPGNVRAIRRRTLIALRDCMRAQMSWEQSR